MTISPSEYEKLGAFYLGREYDVEAKEMTESLLMYDSKDLVTHGVVLGMTGSGKTGLCLALLEEAAIDRVPALIIDPKGDIANLLLTFPDLAGSDFRPWINEEDAHRKGKTPDEFAAAQAELWKKGLGEWGQSGDRIRMLRETVDITVFTPGSTAGVPVSILASLGAPEEEVLDDSESYSDRIASTASSILGLLGINADPVNSREHILLSRIFDFAWRAGKSLDLPTIIAQVQAPPFSKVGVVALEEFYPEKKRTELAMQINNLLAAPGFQNWLTGVPLDIRRMLHTPEGKPRISIFSIAHLNDAERMFFVSLLLNQTLGWMRAQSGTTSLRALLYMDEIFGYLPPSQNPPSKKPMMTLLKQSRAFGLGVLLATQNPVDLDYKALSNIGTWFLGRLQTERDKARVLDGLEGAAASQGSSFDRASMDRLLAGLGNRIFLMNNVHNNGPCVMQVRWCLSYLRGPLTRSQLKSLVDPVRDAILAEFGVSPASAANTSSPAAAASSAPEASAADPAPPATSASGRPDLPESIVQTFFPVSSPSASPLPVVYTPAILTELNATFSDKSTGTNAQIPYRFLLRISPEAAGLPAGPGDPVDLADTKLSAQPLPGSPAWANLPAFARKPAAFNSARDAAIEHVYARCSLDLLTCPALGEVSQPGEAEGDFRARLQHAARERRDQKLAEIERKWGPKLRSAEEARNRAAAAFERERAQANAARVSTVVNVGQAILGALFGRKSTTTLVSRSAQAARGANRAWNQGSDVERAVSRVESAETDAARIQEDLESELNLARQYFDVSQIPLEKKSLSPLKKNIAVTTSALAWIPCYDVGNGQLEPAWED